MFETLFSTPGQAIKTSANLMTWKKIAARTRIDWLYKAHFVIVTLVLEKYRLNEGG
jgi:hypothetical protein